MLYSNLLYVYLASTTINAVGALILVKRQGSKYVKQPFRIASMMQLSLMWSAYRFRPQQEIGEDYQILRVIDGLSAANLIITNLSVDYYAIDLIRQGGKGIYRPSFAIAPLFGSFATWLLSIYPI